MFFIVSPFMLLTRDKLQRQTSDCPDWAVRKSKNNHYFLQKLPDQISTALPALRMYNFPLLFFFFFLNKLDATFTKRTEKKERRSPDAHMPCIQPH